ncbi:PAS domain S-box protein [Leptothrix discophora]|uniref:PAS domain S-box protein n=1 Tax=Leptothrix discophora TaxID=89 RepID=A0ABT9G5N0_LEPDI|nr:PAS domain S-box protein [Leptothrix discophora]MDP4301791.1 PAS domain S-box protein [Leptothrix discophora]
MPPVFRPSFDLSAETTDPVELARWRAIVEDQAEAISLARPGDLVRGYVNPSYAALYGLPREALVGHCLLDQVPPQDRATVRERLAAVLADGRTERSENRIVQHDGEVRWVSWTNRALRAPDGRVEWLHSVGRDITDEVRGREALARLAAVVESSADAIVSKTLTGTITSWNAAATALFGHAADEVLGRSILMLVPPERIDEENDLLARVRAGEAVRGHETERRHADGRYLHVAVTLSPIRDAAGRIVGVSKLARDIGDRLRLQRALADREAQFRALYDRTPAMLQSIDGEGRLLSVSDAWLEHLGYRRDEVIGRRSVDFMTPASRRHALEQVLPAFFREGRNRDVAYQMVRRDGSVIDVRLSSVLERDAEGRPLRSMAVVEDVTERLRLARGLEAEHERLHVALHAIADAVITTDALGRIDDLNPVAESLTGWSRVQALGQPVERVFQLVHERSRAALDNPVLQCLADGRAVPLVPHGLLLAQDGHEFGVEHAASPMRGIDGRLIGVVLVFRDVTAQRRMASEMNYRATHDALTGLVNRSEFEERLQRALGQCHDTGCQHALMFIDLDEFKLVNDSSGHAAGDQLLRQVAGLLQRTVRGRDTLARLGGDEFAVILEHCPPDQAQRLAQQVCDQMDEFRFVHGERRFRIGASIGLVGLDARWRDTAGLMQAADSACMSAKAAGRNRVHMSDDHEQHLQTLRGEAQWAARIDAALEDHALPEHTLVLHAQRIVPVGGREGDDDAAPPGRAPLHAEVLLRMADGRGGLIAPGAFLPAAERFHRAGRIDRWVLRRVLALLGRLRPWLQADDLLAVNVSGQSVSDRAFHRLALELVDADPALARHLCLEITETAAITRPHDAAAFVTELRQRGVRVALDDFGAGASSFGYLKSLPVDFLKIDGQFIRGLGTDPLDLAAVRSFCDVASVIGVPTVAEFVEHPATLDELRCLGVTWAQGHLLHRPEPLAALLLRLLEVPPEASAAALAATEPLVRG